MSKPEKSGMNFFQNFATGKSSLLKGMKIKGPKQTKTVAQSQTNFNFTQKNHEETVDNNITRDDIFVKREEKSEQIPKQQEKFQDSKFKKGATKLSQTSSQKYQKQIERSPSVLSSSNHSQTDSNKLSSPVSRTFIEEKKEVRVQRKQPDYSTKPEAIIQQKKPLVSNKQQKRVIPTKKNESQATNIAQARKSSVGQKKIQQEQKNKKTDRELVLDQINEYTIKLANLILSQRQIKANITQSCQLINEARTNIAKWTVDQGTCAERQEYQQAGRLQQKIQQSQKDIQKKQTELDLLEQQMTKQQYEEITLLRTQNNNMKRVGRKLKLIELQLQDDAANLKRKRIARIQKDITYQSEQIGEFQKAIQSQMNSKINPLQKQLKQLQQQKYTLDQQIEELERRLKEKRGELVQTNKKLTSVNDVINQINKSYSDQIGRLKDRKNKLEITQNERDEMQISFNDLQHTILVQGKVIEAKYELKLGEANELSQLAKSIEQKQASFQDQIETRRVALDTFLLNSKILKEYVSKHREQKEKARQVQLKKNVVTAEIIKLQQKKDQLRKKIPLLQAEQKKLAEVKNYKAAALKKTEVKEINEQLQKIKRKIEDLIGQEYKLSSDLEEMISSQKQSLEEEATLEKSLAVSQHRFCTEKLKKIKQYKGEIDKASGINPREKQKTLKELVQEILRLQAQLKYLNVHYQLGIKAQVKDNESIEPEGEVLEEEENQVEDADQREERQELIEQDDDNSQNNQKQGEQYEPPTLVIDQPEEIEEDIGYTPLQLD